jgi:hypothetical protein
MQTNKIFRGQQQPKEKHAAKLGGKYFLVCKKSKIAI